MRRSRRYVRHSVFMPMDRGHLAKRENTPTYRSRGDRLAGTKTKSALNLEVLSRSFAPVRDLLVFDRHDARATMTRTDDIDHVQIVLFDQPVEVNIEKIQSRRRAPMAKQTRLDMFELEWGFEQRIVL